MDECKGCGWPSKTWVDDVRDFHTKFPVDYKNSLQEREAMMREELLEFHNAVSEAQCLDAIVDLIYFAIGTAIQFGWPIEKAWDLVHAANMQKIVGRTKRGFKVDMKKPDGWVEPDIDSLFKKDAN